MSSLASIRAPPGLCSGLTMPYGEPPAGTKPTAPGATAKCPFEEARLGLAAEGEVPWPQRTKAGVKGARCPPPPRLGASDGKGDPPLTGATERRGRGENGGRAKAVAPARGAPRGEAARLGGRPNEARQSSVTIAAPAAAVRPADHAAGPGLPERLSPRGAGPRWGGGVESVRDWLARADSGVAGSELCSGLALRRGERLRERLRLRPRSRFATSLSPLPIRRSRGEKLLRGEPSRGEPSRGEPLRGEPSRGEPS